MYLSIGNDMAVRASSIIGIFDLDNTSTSKRTREFLEKNENGRVVVPKGAVVVSGSKPISKGPSSGSGIHLYCPVIVKYRDEKTSASVCLEELLR